MGKQSGLGDNLYVSGYNVSGDVGAIGRVGGGPSALEVTGIDKGGFERLGGVRDGAFEYTGFFNDSPLQLHEALSALPTSDQILTYCRGTEVGGNAACLVGKSIDYQLSRGQDGSLGITTSALPSGFGIEWGTQLTAGQVTHTAATNGTSIDTLASASFGAQAYLHVKSFTGTSATVVVQDSADDVSFATVTGLTFGSVTAGPQGQRVQTGRTQAVRRYLRVASTGTFTELVLSVTVVKNETAVDF